MNKKLWLPSILFILYIYAFSIGVIGFALGLIILAIGLQIILIFLDYTYTNKKISHSLLLIILCFFGWITFFSTDLAFFVNMKAPLLAFLKDILHFSEKACFITTFILYPYIIPLMIKILLTTKYNKSQNS